LLIIPDSRYPAEAVEERLQRFCEGIRATSVSIRHHHCTEWRSGDRFAGTISTIKIEPVKPPEKPDDNDEPKD
jgi:hypothetical protein